MNIPRTALLLAPLFGLIQFAAAQHAAIRLPMADSGQEPLNVVSIDETTSGGLFIRRNLGNDAKFLEWEKLSGEREDYEELNMLYLWEARKLANRSTGSFLAMGAMVDELLERRSRAEDFQRRNPREARQARDEDQKDGKQASFSPGKLNGSNESKFLDAVDETSFQTWQECSFVEHPANEADCFFIQDQEGQKFLLRLYFIDSPESSREAEELTKIQAEDLGLTVFANEAVGLRAKEITRVLLNQEPFTVITAKQAVAGSQLENHIYGFVVLGGRESTKNCESTLSAELTLRGLARLHGAPANPPGPKTTADLEANLAALQQRAKSHKLGAWALSKKTNDR